MNNQAIQKHDRDQFGERNNTFQNTVQPRAAVLYAAQIINIKYTAGLVCVVTTVAAIMESYTVLVI